MNRSRVPAVLSALLLTLPTPCVVHAQSSTEDAGPARLMLLGLFHFDKRGLDAVKHGLRDVMQPKEQAYLVKLAAQLTRFAPA